MKTKQFTIPTAKFKALANMLKRSNDLYTCFNLDEKGKKVACAMVDWRTHSAVAEKTLPVNQVEQNETFPGSSEITPAISASALKSLIKTLPSDAAEVTIMMSKHYEPGKTLPETILKVQADGITLHKSEDMVHVEHRTVAEKAEYLGTVQTEAFNAMANSINTITHKVRNLDNAPAPALFLTDDNILHSVAVTNQRGTIAHTTTPLTNAGGNSLAMRALRGHLDGFKGIPIDLYTYSTLRTHRTTSKTLDLYAELLTTTHTDILELRLSTHAQDGTTVYHGTTECLIQKIEDGNITTHRVKKPHRFDTSAHLDTIHQYDRQEETVSAYVPTTEFARALKAAADTQRNKILQVRMPTTRLAFTSKTIPVPRVIIAQLETTTTANIDMSKPHKLSTFSHNPVARPELAELEVALKMHQAGTPTIRISYIHSNNKTLLKMNTETNTYTTATYTTTSTDWAPREDDVNIR